MQENGKGESKQGAEAVGERPEMSEPRTSLSNASSPTRTDTPSTPATSSPTSETQNGKVVPLSLSSSSQPTGYVSSFMENDSEEWVPEGEFEMSFTIKVKGFGYFEKEENKIAKEVMRGLATKLSDFEVRDEAGRMVVWDRTHPERPVIFQEPPSNLNEPHMFVRSAVIATRTGNICVCKRDITDEIHTLS